MTIDNVMATINFIRSTSSLQHRLFRMLLSEMSAEHHDLLLHNDVRWLSKGKALERFCGLREEIITFLRSSKHKKAETHLSRILDNNFMADACFLSDIFKHLNDLNLALQGRDKTVIDLVEQMRAFPVKLDLFATDLSTGRMLHFPTLRKFISSPHKSRMWWQILLRSWKLTLLVDWMDLFCPQRWPFLSETCSLLH